MTNAEIAQLIHTADRIQVQVERIASTMDHALESLDRIARSMERRDRASAAAMRAKAYRAAVEHYPQDEKDLLERANLLDEVFRDLLWRHRVTTLRQRYADVAFTVRRPELFTIATLSPANGKRGPIVYPGSPIGEEETELFDCVDPSIRLHTIDDWYVRHRS